MVHGSHLLDTAAPARCGRSRRGAAGRPTPPGAISPSTSSARAARPAESMPAAPTVSAISGTESSASEAWPSRCGIWDAGTPVAEQLARLAVAAAGGEHGRGQVADPGEAGEGVELGAAGEREVDALAPDLGGRDAGGVQAVGRGRGGGERGGVLGGAGDLDADPVAGALADEAGAVEDLAELGAQVGVVGAEHERGGAGGRLAGVRGAAEAGDRAGADALGDVLGRQRAHRRDEALREQQDSGAGADPVAERADGRGQRCGRDGEADEVEPGRPRSRRRA